MTTATLGVAPTSTPSPTPTVEPTPTPTATVEPTPTATAEPTPTPTPTAVVLSPPTLAAAPSARTETTISVRFYRSPAPDLTCKPDLGYEVLGGAFPDWHDVGGFAAACEDPDPGYKFTGLTPGTTYTLSIRGYRLGEDGTVWSTASSMTATTLGTSPTAATEAEADLVPTPMPNPEPVLAPSEPQPAGDAAPEQSVAPEPEQPVAPEPDPSPEAVLPEAPTMPEPDEPSAPTPEAQPDAEGSEASGDTSTAPASSESASTP